MKTGDQYSFLQIPSHGDPCPADFSSERDTIALTSEAAEILSLILDQLTDFPSPQKAALLLSGDLGVDKSRLLHYLGYLLANPEHSLWSPFLQCLSLGDGVRPKAPIRSHFIQIPLDPSKDLGLSLIESLQRDASDKSTLPSAGSIAAEEFLTRMQQIAAGMAEQSSGMIVLEDISERIEQSRDPEKLQRELRLYWILSEVFSQRGILAVLLGKERHFNAEDRQTPTPAGGEEAERNYSWIEFENPSSFTLPKSVSAREEEFHECLQLLIYDWIKVEIPLWRPDRDPRFRRDSQALAAEIPDGGGTPAGLVYIKNVFDSYWSAEDLDRLRATAYPWILMILSPCERFYEFEDRLREIVSHLPMLMIWRPDTPFKMELERLRSLSLGSSGQMAGGATPGDETIKKIHPILASLYLSRGRLIDASGHYAIGDEIKNRTISQYLAACLSRLPLKKSKTAIPVSPPAAAAGDSQALQWAAMLAGRPELQNSGVAYAQEQLMDWWETKVETLSGKLPALPQSFRTTRFWSEIKYVDSPLKALQPVFHSLHPGAFSFSEAMDHVGRYFAWDRNRLLQWKQGLESLEGFTAWLPDFMHARNYLKASFPLDREKPDCLRESLLQSIDEPHRFLDASSRKEFDEKFAEFKKNYIDSYYRLHENALRAMSGLKKGKIKVDSVALRNLGLLSGLRYMDKRYLNRVKFLAQWMQRNQCNLPLRQILERYPRCYCNFNPGCGQQPAYSAPQINQLIQDGIEYFRTVLRKYGRLIMPELKPQQVDDGSLRQITSLLSDVPMIPLTPQSIRVLNRIIAKYPTEFLTESRRKSRYARH